MLHKTGNERSEAGAAVRAPDLDCMIRGDDFPGEERSTRLCKYKIRRRTGMRKKDSWTKPLKKKEGRTKMSGEYEKEKFM